MSWWTRSDWYGTERWKLTQTKWEIERDRKRQRQRIVLRKKSNGIMLIQSVLLTLYCLSWGVEMKSILLAMMIGLNVQYVCFLYICIHIHSNCKCNVSGLNKRWEMLVIRYKQTNKQTHNHINAQTIDILTIVINNRIHNSGILSNTFSATFISGCCH